MYEGDLSKKAKIIWASLIFVAAIGIAVAGRIVGLNKLAAANDNKQTVTEGAEVITTTAEPTTWKVEMPVSKTTSSSKTSRFKDKEEKGLNIEDQIVYETSTKDVSAEAAIISSNTEVSEPTEVVSVTVPTENPTTQSYENKEAAAEAAKAQPTEQTDFVQSDFKIISQSVNQYGETIYEIELPPVHLATTMAYIFEDKTGYEDPIWYTLEEALANPIDGITFDIKLKEPIKNACGVQDDIGSCVYDAINNKWYLVGHWGVAERYNPNRDLIEQGLGGWVADCDGEEAEIGTIEVEITGVPSGWE